MRQTCIVTSCTNFACRTSDVDFFYLPADRAKARSWLKVLRRTDLFKALGRFDYHVCARHFSQRQYSNNSKFSRPRLVPHAVPDKCLPNEAGEEEEHGSVAEQKPSANLSATTLKRVEIPCNSAGVSYDNAEHDEVQDSHVVDGLQLKLEHTQAALPPQLKDIPGVAGLQRKVVRLRLPPGMSVKEFAASEAMKNITDKLSDLVDSSSDTNKTFVLKLQAPQGNTDSSCASGSCIQEAKTQDEGTAMSNDSTEPSINVSSSIAPTKLKMIRIAKDGHLDVGLREGSSGSGVKTTYMTLREKKASRIALEDDTDDDDDENYEVRSPKRMYSGSSLNSEIRVVKRTKLHHTDTGSSSGGDVAGSSTHEKQYTVSEVRVDGSSGAACSREEPYTLSSSSKTNRSNKSLVGQDASKKDPRILGLPNPRPTTIQGYHTQLIIKQAKREQLIRKIRQQKELLLQRGKELCRYRLQLKRLRDNRSRLSEMTLPECLRILKGNMHEHALELLYTQLVGQDEPSAAAGAAECTAGGSGGVIGQSAGEGQSENSAASAAATTTKDVVYTPKVLESALLFSVAGKKAYKAMSQSLKLPAYSDIIKWKKIIRSDPPFYKKHFPNLRAKFFKRRKTEEKKPKKRGKAAEEEEQDGWHTDGECVKQNDAISKSEENNSISPEEAEHLYQRLLTEQEKFERIFAEDNQTHDDMALEEADLPDLPIDDYDIDLDVDASEFIKRLRQKEKLNLCSDEQWERELEQLHEMDADDMDSSLTDRNHGDTVSGDLQTVNEVINRVINKVVKNVTTASDAVVDKSSRHASTAAATPGCSGSSGGNVIPVDTPTIEISSASVVTVVDSHGDTLPDIESGPDGADNHHHDTLFMADDDGAIIAQTSDGEKIAYVPAQATAITTGQDSMSTSSFVSTVDVGPSSAVVTNTIADNSGVHNIVYLRVPAVSQERAYTVSEQSQDEATPGPSMPKIF